MDIHKKDSSSQLKLTAIVGYLAAIVIGITACAPSDQRSDELPATDVHADKSASQDVAHAEGKDEAQLIPTLAILPFKNKGTSRNYAFLATGLTQAVTDRVTESGLINVSVRPYAAASDRLGSASELAVTGINTNAILQGSVDQTEDQFVITIQLTDSMSGKSLWKHEYQHPESEFNMMTGEIATGITRTMTGVAPGTTRQISSLQAEAYPYYLRGRHFFGEQSVGLVKARKAFEKAIELDPQFDNAWAWLSATLLVTPDHIQDGTPGNTRAELYKRAQETVSHTLSLNGKNALAHAVAGRLAQASNQWADAEAALSKAVTLDPFNDMIRNWRGQMYLFVGHIKKAREDFAEAVKINPLNSGHFEMLGYALLAETDYNAAEVAIEQALKMKRLTATLPMVFLHMAKGEKTRARELMENYIEYLGYSRKILPIKLYLQSIDGEDRSDEMYQVLLKGMESGRKFPKFVLLLATLGKYDQALEHAAKQNILNLPGIPANLWMPNMRGIVERPAFPDLAKRLGLIGFWQSNGYPDHCRKAVDNDRLVCDF